MSDVPQDQMEALRALHDEGRLDDVIAMATTMAAHHPDSLVLSNVLGSTHARLGQFADAVPWYRHALRIDPTSADAHCNLGSALCEAGQVADAVVYFQQALRIRPDWTQAHKSLSLALARAGRPEEAMACVMRWLEIAPDWPEALFILGQFLTDTQRYDEAIAQFAKVLQAMPQLAHAHDALATALARARRLDDAVASYATAIDLDPGFAAAHYNLGCILREAGRHREAMESFARAVETAPDFADAHNDLGSMLQFAGRLDEAIACFQAALRIRTDHVGSHNNLGNALLALGRPNDAIASYCSALKIDPKYPLAHNNLGSVYASLGRYTDAIESFRQALAIDPGYSAARAELMYQCAHICDWQPIAENARYLPALGIDGPAVSPFAMLALEDHPARQRTRSERYTAERFPTVYKINFPRPGPRPDLLRIGYFSADFHDHATMNLIARLFELHDRRRFAVHIYSYGPDRHDTMRSRLVATADSFRDVRALGDDQIAQIARDDRIDIAVDLKGYTTDMRAGILMCRPAPIQISYLGYPGTSGAPFIDYLIADHTLVPEDHRHHYSESLIYLPGSYQVNDDRRIISSQSVTRRDMGLPETGFVFCSFNNNYKISPTEFDIWMRLLSAVPGSVLWLLKGNRWAPDNLCAEACKRGIDPQRLVFADKVPVADHLARQRLADLFLDSFTCNAHTTASDALWVGLPVLTKLGDGFAARVGASLLTALDMPELITHSVVEYERKALALATDRECLQDIRRKLTERGNSAKLFDSARFARNIERAYDLVWEHYLKGDKPAVLNVEDIAGIVP